MLVDQVGDAVAMLDEMTLAEHTIGPRIYSSSLSSWIRYSPSVFLRSPLTFG